MLSRIAVARLSLSPQNRSVMSIPVGTTNRTSPASSLMGMQANSTTRSEPSAQK